MKNETRAKIKEYRVAMAEANGIQVEDTETKFTVAPSVQQRLETKTQESSAFLQKIIFSIF